MHNNLDATANHSPDYLSREQFIFLCPRAFLLHRNNTPGFKYQSLTTKTKGPLLHDKGAPNHHLFGGIVTSIDNNSNIFQSSDDSSTSSPQTPASESVNSQNGSAFTSPGRNVFPSHPSPPVNNHSQVKITCGVCQKQVSAKNFIAHLEVHDPCRNQHICGICERQYFRPRDLKKHRKDKHRYVAPRNDRHVCGLCGCSFKNHRLLRAHRKAFQCGEIL